MLELQPVSFRDAAAFVGDMHRHNNPPPGWKFGIGVSNGERLVGVAMVGRPVARHMDDGWTLEVNRVCTDGSKNACSKLYGACAKASRAMGYKRLITYTLKTESGSSLRASGWRTLYDIPSRTWSTPSRPRTHSHASGERTLWEHGDDVTGQICAAPGDA